MLSSLILPLAAAASSGSGIWESLYRASRSVIDDKLGDFVSVAVVVAALFAAWTLLKTTMDWTKGGSHDLWQLLRPLVIVLCVLNFSALSGAFDGLANIFCREISEHTESGIGDMMAKVQDACKAGGDTLAEEGEDVMHPEGRNFAERAWNWVKGAFTYAAKTVLKVEQVGVFTVETFVCRFVIDLMFLVFQVISAMFLTVLRLIGPFAFAVAAYEPWSGSIRSWCERYIETSLWMPIGFIVIGIMTNLYGVLATTFAQGGGLEHGAFFIGVAMIVASFRAIKSIPEIAGWVIAGTAHGLQNMNPTVFAGYAQKAVKGDVGGMIEKMSR